MPDVAERGEKRSRSMDALACGWDDFRAGRYARAEGACREVLQTFPDDSAAWHLLGLISFRLRQFGESELSYRRALSARPDLAEGARWSWHRLS